MPLATKRWRRPTDPCTIIIITTTTAHNGGVADAGWLKNGAKKFERLLRQGEVRPRGLLEDTEKTGKRGGATSSAQIPQ
ncbi:hypothetical protein CH63R_12918 [Colletotrichum higginsianum IMI 349063]|uniref:Uncharacterized protein n=1 Tax=Colletotrichum higginsianum (strain IMI 349063) TaxID=759273 RepID=A0A1B7XVL2_COLHI|nr:hypothetical protein CH63R_12918 [Colletotrichum higginsianum IMI 349063]OBR03791.1 hypothetical protein CH63R_12918 [Colletotrichum higginsianum IMI 349063]